MNITRKGAKLAKCRPLRLGVRFFELPSHATEALRIIQPNLPPNPINQQTSGDVMHWRNRKTYQALASMNIVSQRRQARKV